MSESISILQSHLLNLGYNPGVVDGYDGPNTLAAAKAWRNHDYPSDLKEANAARAKDPKPEQEEPIVVVVPSTLSNLSVGANHRLTGVPFIQAHSRSTGGTQAPTLVVMHYTAGAQSMNTPDYFRSGAEGRYVSAHIVIGRNGEVVQCVPFNITAGHCAPSQWTINGKTWYSNMNTIGIEMENWGELSRNSAGNVAYDGINRAPYIVHEGEYIYAAHPKQPGVKRYWQNFTQAQFDASVAVVKAICKKYNIAALTTHWEGAPTRRDDTGPAYDMTKLRQAVMS